MARKKKDRQFEENTVQGLNEIRKCIEDGVPLSERFLVRTVEIPEPGAYSAKAVKAVRERVGVSQAIFARMLGVSTILVSAWEQGNRQPSPLARRLLDTVRADPSAWLATVQRVSQTGRRAG